MAGLFNTSVLLGEDRNYFVLPLDSTDSLLKRLALDMLLSLWAMGCGNHFCTNFPVALTVSISYTNYNTHLGADSK